MYLGTLPLTTVFGYNGVSYLTSQVLRNYAASWGGNQSFTYTLGYRADNLVSTVDPGYLTGPIADYYDQANRVRCYDNGTQLGVPSRAWSYYPDGNRQYAYDSGGGGFHWRCPVSDSQTDPGPYITATRERYTYSGQELTLREWQPYDVSDPTTVNAVSTYSYDGGGNLTQEVHVDNQAHTTTTLGYDWSWQGAANRLTTFTAASGITTVLTYDRLGRIIRRTTALGHSEYSYEDGTDWLVRETWHVTTTGPVYDLVRFYYVNGLPARVDYALDVNSPNTGYQTAEIQYDWDGNAIAGLTQGGTDYGGLSGLGAPITPGAYDLWGNVSWPFYAPAWRGYWWHAAQGYLWFADLGLYYIHGRWWSPDTGRFLSPNEKGDYLYGGDGPCEDDAVNCAWFTHHAGAGLAGSARVNARVYYLNAVGDYPTEKTIRPNPDLGDEAGYYLYRLGQIVGPENVKHIPIFILDQTYHTWFSFLQPYRYNELQFMAEWYGFRIWSPKVVNYIAQDIAANPLAPGTRIIMVRNSGGGAIAVSSLQLLQEKGITVDQIILRGSAVLGIVTKVREVDYVTAKNGFWDDKFNYSLGINLRGSIWKEFRVDSLAAHVPNLQATKDIADLMEDLITR